MNNNFRNLLFSKSKKLPYFGCKMLKYIKESIKKYECFFSLQSFNLFISQIIDITIFQNQISFGVLYSSKCGEILTLNHINQIHQTKSESDFYLNIRISLKFEHVVNSHN